MHKKRLVQSISAQRWASVIDRVIQKNLEGLGVAFEVILSRPIPIVNNIDMWFYFLFLKNC